MRVRFWSLDALAGTVAGEIPVLDWSLDCSLQGGELRATVDLNAATRDGRIPDYPEVRRRHSLVQPGFRTIVATGVLTDEHGRDRMDTRRILGEYISRHTSPSSHSTRLPITGTSWEAYPSYRAQAATQRHASIDTGVWARAMLQEVYAGASITVPAFTSGVTATGVDRPIWSGQWADALREATEADPGIEWIVESIPTWDGTTLTGVTRTVVWGSPEIRRSTDILLEAGEPMTRQGNCTITGGGERFSDYARQVVVLGAGEGAKQPVSIASNSGLSARGYLDASKIVNGSDINAKSMLDALARLELKRSQGTKNGQLSLPRDPFQITAWVDKLTVRPRPGDLVHLKHPMSHGYPGLAGAAGFAIDDPIRVGEVSYSGTGPICEQVEVRAL